MNRVGWRRAGIIGLLLCGVVVALLWATGTFNRGGPLDLVARRGAKGGGGDNAADEGSSEGYVIVGGVRRRKSDVAPARQLTGKKGRQGKSPFDYGKLPPVNAEANAHTKAAAAALANDDHPERFSALVRPAAFDLAAFKANPASYLNIVEPGRVFQSAQPGPGVPKLYPGSPQRQHIRQGATAKLRVAVPPGSPVTFTSFDAGAFSNKLTSITVQADPKGTAETEFTATPGTIANVHILASSPVTSGRARFVVNVLSATGGTPRVAAAQP